MRPIADTSDFGIVRFIVNDTEKAYQVLKKAELTATINNVIAVEVADKPGGLASVLAALQSEGQNVEYLYGFLERKTDKAIMIFRFDDMEAAIQVLKKHGVSLLSDQELRDL